MFFVDISFKKIHWVEIASPVQNNFQHQFTAKISQQQ